MRISGEKPFPGANMRIGRAVLQYSPITCHIRSEFLELTFPHQAELIGSYAKKQLKLADKIITTSFKYPSGEIPRAIDFWVHIMGKAAVIDPAKISDQSGTPKINWPSAEMGEVIKQISQIFIGTYSYWVKNFYSCGINGRDTFTNRQASLARTFKVQEMQMIDNISGMPNLGWNMKNYAEILFHMEILRNKNN
jgi:hypothetical protein